MAKLPDKPNQSSLTEDQITGYFVMKTHDPASIDTDFNFQYLSEDDTNLLRSTLFLTDFKGANDFTEGAPVPYTEYINKIQAGTKVGHYAVKPGKPWQVNGPVGVKSLTSPADPNNPEYLIDSDPAVTEQNVFQAVKYYASARIDFRIDLGLDSIDKADSVVGLLNAGKNNPDKINEVAAWYWNTWAFENTNALGLTKKISYVDQDAAFSQSYLEIPGTPRKPFYGKESNLLDILNSIYGSNTIQQKAAANLSFGGFQQLNTNFQTVIRNVVGDIFSDPQLYPHYQKESPWVQGKEGGYLMSGQLWLKDRVTGLSGELSGLQFINLIDTPTGMSGSGGMFLRVDASGSGIEFADPSGLLSTQQITWNYYTGTGALPNADNHSGMLASVVDGGLYYSNSGQWDKIYPPTGNFGISSAGGGSSYFTGLLDTPTGYQANEYLKVTSDATGIEYVSLNNVIQSMTGSVGNTLINQIVNNLSGTGGHHLAQNIVNNMTGITGNNLINNITNNLTGLSGQALIQNIVNNLTGTAGNTLIQNITNNLTGSTGKSFINNIFQNMTGVTGAAGNTFVTQITQNLTGTGGQNLVQNIANYLTGSAGNTIINNISQGLTGVSGQQFISNIFQNMTGVTGTAANNLIQQISYNLSGTTGQNFTSQVLSNIVGTSGKYLQVDNDGTGVNFVDIAFTGLSDTPNAYQNDQFLVISGGNKIEYTDISFLRNIADRPAAEVVSGYLQLDKNRNLVWTPGTSTGDVNYTITGATHFTGLLDTPVGYGNEKFLKGTQNGFEYVSINDGQVAFTGLSDKPTHELLGGYLRLGKNRKLVWEAGTTTGNVNYSITGATHITGLVDTPNGYENDKFLIVSGGNSFEYTDISFLRNIADRPAAEVVSGYLQLDKNRNLVWTPGTSTGDVNYTITGATHFTGLLDTPVGYGNEKFLKGTQNGFEYVNLISEINNSITGNRAGDLIQNIAYNMTGGNADTLLQQISNNFSTTSGQQFIQNLVNNITSGPSDTLINHITNNLTGTTGQQFINNIFQNMTGVTGGAGNTFITQITNNLTGASGQAFINQIFQSMTGVTGAAGNTFVTQITQNLTGTGGQNLVQNIANYFTGSAGNTIINNISQGLTGVSGQQFISNIFQNMTGVTGTAANNLIQQITNNLSGTTGQKFASTVFQNITGEPGKYLQLDTDGTGFLFVDLTGISGNSIITNITNNLTGASGQAFINQIFQNMTGVTGAAGNTFVTQITQNLTGTGGQNFIQNIANYLTGSAGNTIINNISQGLTGVSGQQFISNIFQNMTGVTGTAANNLIQQITNNLSGTTGQHFASTVFQNITGVPQKYLQLDNDGTGLVFVDLPTVFGDTVLLDNVQTKILPAHVNSTSAGGTAAYIGPLQINGLESGKSYLLNTHFGLRTEDHLNTSVEVEVHTTDLNRTSPINNEKLLHLRFSSESGKVMSSQSPSKFFTASGNSIKVYGRSLDGTSNILAGSYVQVMDFASGIDGIAVDKIVSKITGSTADLLIGNIVNNFSGASGQALIKNIANNLTGSAGDTLIQNISNGLTGASGQSFINNIFQNMTGVTGAAANTLITQITNSLTGATGQTFINNIFQNMTGVTGGAGDTFITQITNNLTGASGQAFINNIFQNMTGVTGTAANNLIQQISYNLSGTTGQQFASSIFDNITGTAGKYLQVDSDGTGLIFVDAPQGGGGGGGGSTGGTASSGILFDGSVTSISNVMTNFGGTTNPNSSINFTPNIDIYSAWNSTDRSWEAPRDMQVIVNTTHDAPYQNKNVYARICRGIFNVATEADYQTGVSYQTSYINLSRILTVASGEKIRAQLAMDGGGSTAGSQTMTIAELGGGGGGGGSTGSSILSYETKTLSSDVSNNSSPYDAVIDDLKFDNLEIGQTYLVNAYFSRQTENAANDFVRIAVNHGNDILFELGVYNDPGKINETNSASKIITATGDITVYANSLDGQSKVLSGSYIQVAKLGSSSNGGTGGGGSFGLIASKMDGINFTGELPDIIFQKDENDLEAALILQAQISATNKIQYGSNTAGTNRVLRFDNSATAGNMTNDGTWTLGSNSPGSVSVQHYIDTDKAVYLGGGSSVNGGGGSSTFAGLTETPSSLVTGAGMYLKVSQDGQTIEYADIDPSSSSSNSPSSYSFCKAYFASSQPCLGNQADTSAIHLNPSALEEQSENWTYLSPTYNKTGIKIPEDGLYNIVGEALVNLNNSSTRSDWQANAVNHSFEVKDDNGNRLAFSHNNKAQNNGDSLKADIYAANAYLTGGTILTAHTAHYRAGGAGNYVYTTDVSYLHIEKADAGGGGGGVVLPSGSILQKTSKGFADITNLQTVGTTIAEFDFTPKASGSLVELEFTALYQEDSQSQQQGRFKVDGQFTGGTWYQFHGGQSSSWGANTRTSITHRTRYKTTGTATQNIAMELILDAADPTNLGSIVMSAEEIAQSDYTLAGGGGSSANGGGGSSTFAELLDTPSDLSVGAGKFLKINSAGDGIEYVNASPVGGGGGGLIHARVDPSQNDPFSTKSDNWDAYVTGIEFPQGSWNGYVRLLYDGTFSKRPTVVATARHLSPNHYFAQVINEEATYCDFVIGNTSNQQTAAPFNVVIYSDDITGSSSNAGSSNGGSAYGNTAASGAIILSASAPSQNISPGAVTSSNRIKFNNASIDVYSGLNTSNGIWTAQRDMQILVEGNSYMQYNSSAKTSSVYGRITKNGSQIGADSDVKASSVGTASYLQPIGITNVVSGDQIAFDTWHYGTSTRTFTTLSLDIIDLNAGGSSTAGGGGGGGSLTFAGLTDTPDSLTTGAGKYLKISDDGQTIDYVDAPQGGGGGSSYEFCKAYVASNQSLGTTPVHLNPSTLAKESEDWTYLSPTYNKTGIKIPEDGLYNIFAASLVDFTNNSTLSDWQTNVTYVDIRVQDQNNNTIATASRNKDAGNGDGMTSDAYAPNVYLTGGTILTLNSNYYRLGGGGAFKFNTGYSFLNVEKADAIGGSSSANVEFSKAGFTSTSYLRHNQTNNYSIDTGNFHAGSEDWSYESVSNGVVGLKPPTDGFYDIFGTVSWNRGSSTSSWTTTTQQRAQVVKQNITGGPTAIITEKGSAKYQTLNGPLTLDFQETNVYLSKDEYIYANGYLYNSPSPGTNFPLSPYSYLSLAKAGGGGGGSSANGGGGSSTFAGLTDTPDSLTTGAGKYLKISDDGQTIEYVDAPQGGGGGSSSNSTSSAPVEFCRLTTVGTQYMRTQGPYDRPNWNGAAVTGSQDWAHSISSKGVTGIYPGYAGYYDINSQVIITNSSSNQALTELRLDIYKVNLKTNAAVMLGQGWEHWGKYGYNGPGVLANAYNVYLSEDEAIYTRQYAWRDGGISDHRITNGGNYTYLNVERKGVSSSAGAGNGAFYKQYLDKNSKVEVDRIVNRNVGPNSYLTLFSYNSDKPIYIYGGTYQNSFSWNPEITIDGVIVSDDKGLIVGQDEGNDDISIVHIPPLYATGQVFIRMFNDSVHTQEVGGYVTYATGNDITTVGSPSDTPVFSKMSFLSTDRVGHNGANLTPDSSNLATGAESWVYHDSTNNLYGLRPTSNGYYDIDVSVQVRSSLGDVTSFNRDVGYAHLDITKRNVDDLTTSTLIARDWENKPYDQGADIASRVNESYVYLTTKDVIYASYGMWVKSAGRSNTWGIDRDTSYISLSPSAAGGGGAGGSAATFQELTDTPATMAFGSGKYLKVNDQGTAIEFVNLPGGGGGGASTLTAQCSGQLATHTGVYHHSNFYTSIPDYLVHEINPSNTQIARLYSVTNTAITYSVDPTENTFLKFLSTDFSGGKYVTSQANEETHNYDSLSGYIAADKAIYGCNAQNATLNVIATKTVFEDVLHLQATGAHNTPVELSKLDRSVKSIKLGEMESTQALAEPIINTDYEQLFVGVPSLYFNGYGQHLRGQVDTALGRGDFTIECWIKIPGTTIPSNQGNWRCIISFGGYGTNDLSLFAPRYMTNAASIYNGTAVAIINNQRSTTTKDDSVGGTTRVDDGDWHHIALVRHNRRLKLYTDGIKEGDIESEHSVLYEYFEIGHSHDAAYNSQAGSFYGYMQDLRVVRRAVYTEDFTPPTHLLPISSRLNNEGDLENSTFASLSDTPNTLQSNRYLKVNNRGDAIEFVTNVTNPIPDPTSATFLNGKSLISDPTGNVFKQLSAGPNISLNETSKGIEITSSYISTTGFSQLLDTPNNLVADKFLKVDSQGRTLQFTDIDYNPPVGSGFAKHENIISQDSFDQDLPEHIYLQNAGGTNIQTFNFAQYSQGAYIEYAPVRETDFGTYIRFNDDAEGSFDASSITQDIHNRMSLSGFIHSGRHHYEAARNTGVYNQGFRSVLSPGSADFEGNLSVDPELENVVGTNNNWSQLVFPKMSAKSINWIVPPSLTQNFLNGTVSLDIAWQSSITSRNVVWKVEVINLNADQSIDAAVSTTPISITSSSSSTAYGIVNARQNFNPTPQQISKNGLIMIKLTRDISNGSDNLAGDANLLFLSLIEIV